MMQVCTVVSGHTFDTTSESPLRPSQTRKNVSRTSRFFMSVRTLIQNFAPSPPVPAPQPEDVFLPCQGDAGRGINGPVRDLPVADLHFRIASMKIAALTSSGGRADHSFISSMTLSVILEIVSLLTEAP